MRERMKSFPFACFSRTCALAGLLGLLPAITAAETNLRTADQMVRQARGWNAAGRHEEARQALVRYLERDSRSVLARLEYARTLSYLRQFAEALIEYQHVLKLEPENLEAQVGVAKVTSWRGEFERALVLYNQILQGTPGLHDALVGKAHTLLWLGRKDEATALFLDALFRNPSDREVRRLLEELGVDAGVALEQARTKAALSAAREPELEPEQEPVQEPALAVLPDEIPLSADGPSAQPEQRPKSAGRIRKKPAGAPAPAADPAAAHASLPAPLLMHTATVLILLAGGALAYRTRLVLAGRAEMRRRPLPDFRRPYELPPSSLPLEVKPQTPAKAENTSPAEQTEKPADAAAPAEPAPRPRPETLLWGRILVVHPDEQVLEFTRRVLSGAGAEVLTLRRGEDALACLEKSRLEKFAYDVLLVNDRLPGGWTGMEIYRWVQQHQPGAERSLMLVHSGQGDTHTRQFLEESGALGLAAPFSVSDLLAITRLALEKARTAKSSIGNPPIVN